MSNSRNYAAFISYRHCPLDIRVADALHKRIERYRIPRDLRKNGSKSIGYVFRDREELPLSNNLTADIYEALDNSQFLIVVCTPDTPKSKWVDREIEYFISRHGRDRVLTVLAAGTPDDSIPKRITHDFTPDGSVAAIYEPLCAFLSDPSEKKILKNLKSEFLRLMAAMLNCPYDALRQRQKRYRMQQLTALMAVVTTIAMVFILMLSNRNREISMKNQEILQKNDEITAANEQIAAQLRQSQINESQALTLLSKINLADGDRLGAIENALNALPHDGDNRPYSAAAEGTLADALNVYSSMSLDYHLTIEQPVDVYELTLSEDGRYLVTLDTTGTLRCFDPLSTAMLWEYRLGDGQEYEVEYQVEILEIIEATGIVLYSDRDTTYSFSLETGELLNQVSSYTERNNSGYSTATQIALSPDERYFVQCTAPDARDFDPDATYTDTVHYLEIYSADTFQRLHSHVCYWNENWAADIPAFSLDGSRLAILFSDEYSADLEILVLDTATWKAVFQETISPSEGKYVWNSFSHLAWLPGNELLLYYEQRESANSINTYFVKFSETGESQQVGPYYTYHKDTNGLAISHFLTDTHIYYNISNACVFAIEMDSLERTMYTSTVCAGSYTTKEGRLMLITQGGGIGYVTNCKSTFQDYRIYQFDKEVRMAKGTDGDSEIVCLVPEGAPNTIVVISEPVYIDAVELQIPAMETYDSENESLSLMDYVVFPSGKSVLVMDDMKSSSSALAITIYDAQSLEITDSFMIEAQDELRFSGFSADESKLIFNGFVYDIPTRTLSEYENGASTYGEYATLIDTPEFSPQLPGTPLLAVYERSGTLYWWTDGTNMSSTETPYDMNTYCSDASYTSIPSIGNSGLFIQPFYEDILYPNRPLAYGIFSTETEQWHLLSNPASSTGFPRFAVGNTEKAVAFADFDRMLRVYDFDEDTIIHQWPLTVSPESIVKLQYIADDRYLLIYTQTDYLHLIDMQKGTELGSYYLNYSSTPGTVDVHADAGIVYLFSYTETLRIDLPTGALLATIPDMRCYLPASRRAIRTNVGNQMTVIPIYTWEEMADKGWSLIHTLEENRITQK